MSDGLGGGGSPMLDRKMEEGPDLSHLTPEERAIIESVMMRQRAEEEREQEILR